MLQFVGTVPLTDAKRLFDEYDQRVFDHYFAECLYHNPVTELPDGANAYHDSIEKWLIGWLEAAHDFLDELPPSLGIHIGRTSDPEEEAD